MFYFSLKSILNVYIVGQILSLKENESINVNVCPMMGAHGNVLKSYLAFFLHLFHTYCVQDSKKRILGPIKLTK